MRIPSLLFVSLVLILPNTAAFGQEKSLSPSEAWFERKVFWNHDFKTDQMGDYEIKGDVKWQPGRITLGRDSSIRKTLEGGRVWEVTLDLEFLELTRDGDESNATLLWDLNNRARYGLIWSQTRTDGKIVGELQFVKAVTKPEATKPDAIVEWQMIKVFDTTHISGRQVWTIRWNTGVLEVAAEKIIVLQAYNYDVGSIDSLTMRESPVLRLFRAVANPRLVLSDLQLTRLRAFNQQFTQADRLCSQAKFNEALPIAQNAVAEAKILYGTNHPDYVHCLNRLSDIYAEIDDYAHAEPLLIQAIEIRKATLGENHPRYALSLVDLAKLYLKKADYARAEPLLKQANEIRGKYLRENAHAYAQSLGMLGSLYQSLGDFAGAEPLLQEATELTKKTLGENSGNYAAGLSDIASLYEQRKDFARAELLRKQVIDIHRKFQGKDRLEYSTSLNNLGLLYIRMGDYTRAEPLLKESYEMRKMALRQNHPALANSLNSLAGLYFHLGDIDRALQFSEQSHAIVKTSVGENHPAFAASLHNLAGLHSSIHDYTNAEPLSRRGLGITRQHLDETAVFLSERQQLAMSEGLRFRLDIYLSLALVYPPASRNAFFETFAWKGATLVRQRGIRLAASDPQIAGQFQQLRIIASQIGTLSNSVPDKEELRTAWREKLKRLTEEKETLEAEVSRLSAPYRASKQKPNLAALPPNAVLIDYVEFNRHFPAKEIGKQATIERQLLAFVVRRLASGEEHIELVSLGPVAPIQDAVATWRKSFGSSPAGATAGNWLRETIWQPLLSAAGDAETFLVSTDGVLGQLPLGALPGKEPGKYLLEYHHIAMIPVPQLISAILEKSPDRSPPGELLLLGGVDYDADPNGQPTTTKKKAPRRPDDGLRAPGEDVVFLPLTGTELEVDSLGALYKKLFESTDKQVRSLTRDEATEANFRRFSPMYRHLHLATHGYFASEAVPSANSSSARAAQDRVLRFDRESPVVGYMPGLLSGLALTGANREPNRTLPDADDGLLYSQEISFLPLQNVDTAVLSACETGLGKVADGEGLLGVQRAFQVAGVRTTVASYWKVDDKATLFLMKRFYGNLWEKEMSRLDALREAQLYVLDHPDEIRSLVRDDNEQAPKSARTPPYFWGAFALSGDWR